MPFDEKGHYEPSTDEVMWRKTKRWLIAGAVLLFVVLPLGAVGFRWVTADARGAIGAREQIKANPDFRIAAYQKFFDLCSAVQAQEDRAAIFASDPSPAGQTNLRAVQAKRAQLVREYNADAARTYTEGQFRSSDLPFRLDPTTKETRCTADDA